MVSTLFAAVGLFPSVDENAVQCFGCAAICSSSLFSSSVSRASCSRRPENRASEFSLLLGNGAREQKKQAFCQAFSPQTMAHVTASLNCQLDEFLSDACWCCSTVLEPKQRTHSQTFALCPERKARTISLRRGCEHLWRETHASRAENNSHILTEADIPIHPVLICNHGENELYSDFGTLIHKNNHSRADRMNDGD